MSDSSSCRAAPNTQLWSNISQEEATVIVVGWWSHIPPDSLVRRRIPRINVTFGCDDLLCQRSTASSARVPGGVIRHYPATQKLKLPQPLLIEEFLAISIQDSVESARYEERPLASPLRPDL
jgi:hypothetical protein